MLFDFNFFNKGYNHFANFFSLDDMSNSYDKITIFGFYIAE